MNLAIGTKVRWESAAGVKRGTITNIVLGPAANDKVTPWIPGTDFRHVSPQKCASLCQ